MIASRKELVCGALDRKPIMTTASKYVKRHTGGKPNEEQQVPRRFRLLGMTPPRNSGFLVAFSSSE